MFSYLPEHYPSRHAWCPRQRADNNCSTQAVHRSVDPPIDKLDECTAMIGLDFRSRTNNVPRSRSMAPPTWRAIITCWRAQPKSLSNSKPTNKPSAPETATNASEDQKARRMTYEFGRLSGDFISFLFNKSLYFSSSRAKRAGATNPQET